MAEELTLIPQDERTAEWLILNNKDNAIQIKDQIVVKVPKAKLNQWLNQLPSQENFSFRILEEDRIIQLMSELDYLEEEVRNAFVEIQNKDIKVSQLLYQFLKEFRIIKNEYRAKIGANGITAWIGKDKITIPWEGNILFNGDSRCYEPRASVYRTYQKKLQIAGLLTLLSQALNKTSRFEETEIPLTETEEKILVKKFLERSNITLPQEIKTEDIRIAQKIQSLLQGIANAMELKETKFLHKEWKWLEKVYQPKIKIIRQNNISIQIARYRIIISDNLTIRVEGPWDTPKDTIELILSFGPKLAIEMAKLYGQGRISALAIFILGNLHEPVTEGPRKI